MWAGKRPYSVIQRRKLKYFGHIARSDTAYAQRHYMEELTAGVRGRPYRRRMDDVVKWTRKPIISCIRRAKDRDARRTWLSTCTTSDHQQRRMDDHTPSTTIPILSLLQYLGHELVFFMYTQLLRSRISQKLRNLICQWSRQETNRAGPRKFLVHREGPGTTVT